MYFSVDKLLLDWVAGTYTKGTKYLYTDKINSMTRRCDTRLYSPDDVLISQKI
jgi:hypothetical protein